MLSTTMSDMTRASTIPNTRRAEALGYGYEGRLRGLFQMIACL